MTDDRIPPDADLQRLDALRRDLQAAVDRAIVAGVSPADVITCTGMMLGACVHQMRPSPPDAAVGALITRLVRLGRAEDAENAVANGLEREVYGGEARRRRRR